MKLRSSEESNLLVLVSLSVCSAVAAANLVFLMPRGRSLWLFVCVVGVLQTAYWGWRLYRERREP